MLFSNHPHPSFLPVTCLLGERRQGRCALEGVSRAGDGRRTELGVVWLVSCRPAEDTFALGRVRIDPGPGRIERMSLVEGDPAENARERILDASYDLFLERGVRAVGINEIISAAGVAKASFYSHFPSKNELILAFLSRRRDLFTIGYLGAEARKRGNSAHEQLLAIFDIFDEWFRAADFTGCPYIRALVETGAGDQIGAASAGYLQEMRAEVETIATAMRLTDPQDFAECWMILLQGSVVAAMGTGYTSPHRIRKLGQLLITSHTSDHTVP